MNFEVQWHVSDDQAEFKDLSWVRRGLRLLRGRALVKLDPSELGAESVTASGLVIPWHEINPRDQKIHRGRVLALGPPGKVKRESGAELPWDISIGDEVYFVYALALEKVRKFDDAVVVGQAEIVAVIE
jgi:co-chaperonin GroES (HSP10)